MGCSPDIAEEIDEPREVFRLVRTNPPTEFDFRSQREEKPDRAFPDECQLEVCLFIRSGETPRKH